MGGPPGAVAPWLAFTLPSALALVLFAHGVSAYGGVPDPKEKVKELFGELFEET